MSVVITQANPQSPHTWDRLDKNGKMWGVPDVFVMHIAEGSYYGTIAWEQNKSSEVSSHFVISKKGEVTQLVPIKKAAFTQALRYNWENKAPMVHQAKSKLICDREVNPNCYCVSVEFEGKYSECHGKITDAQLEAVVEVIKWCNQHGAQIPYDREHIIGHCDINPLYRPHCPGEEFPYDEIIRRLNKPEQAEDFEAKYKAIKLALEAVLKTY